MATLIVYPDADPESTTFDGMVYTLDPGDTWANVRSKSGDFADAAGAINVGIQTDPVSPDYNTIKRALALFDLGSAPGSAAISATLSLYITGKNNPLGWANNRVGISVVKAITASNTDATTSDYENMTTTKFCTDIDYDNLPVGQYSDFTFNSTGLTEIDTVGTGILKLGQRMQADVDDNPGAWVSNVQTYLIISQAEIAGTTQDSKLTIVYETVFKPKVIFI